MCKYEMDPTSIVEATERTRFCPQMDGRTDGQTDGRRETSIPTFQLRWSGGMINTIKILSGTLERDAYIDYKSTVVTLMDWCPRQQALPGVDQGQRIKIY